MKKFCAYIDVLGFSALLDNWKRAVKYYNDMQSLLSQVVEWYQVVTRNMEQVMPEMKPANLEYCVFSDAIIITSTKASSLVFACSDIQYNGLLKGYCFRGAISYGRHLDNLLPGKSLIVSRALRDAYLLESTKAEVPRILIDPSQLNEIKDDLGLTLNPDSLAQSEDGYWFVNFLNGRNELTALSKTISKHIASKKNKAMVHKKYLWLAHFFNFVVTNKNSRFSYDASDAISIKNSEAKPKPEFLIHPYEGEELKSRFNNFEKNRVTIKNN